MIPQQRVIPLFSLTGVRGVAAIWVFLYHTGGFIRSLLYAPFKDTMFVANGFRGVDLFFALSGFILMHVHAKDFVEIDATELKRFFIIRFFRVYPLNTVILLLMVPLVILLPAFAASDRAYMAHNLSIAGFVQSLLLVQSFTILKLGEWNIVSWTLSAEVLGYLLFPIMASMIVRETSWARCVSYIMASLSTLTLLLFVFHHANNNPTGTFGSVRMFFCFFAGVAAYRCYQLLPEASRYASLITLISLLFIMSTLLVKTAPVLDVFGFVGLIFGLAYQRGPINAVLASPVALFLGKISFSFYMIHFLIINVTRVEFGGYLLKQDMAYRVAALFALIAACFLSAIMLHYGVEQPAQRFGRRFAKRLVQTESFAVRAKT